MKRTKKKVVVVRILRRKVYMNVCEIVVVDDRVAAVEMVEVK